jgi:hypothetical protein
VLPASIDGIVQYRKGVDDVYSDAMHYVLTEHPTVAFSAVLYMAHLYEDSSDTGYKCMTLRDFAVTHFGTTMVGDCLQPFPRYFSLTSYPQLQISSLSGHTMKQFTSVLQQTCIGKSTWPEAGSK